MVYQVDDGGFARSGGADNGADHPDGKGDGHITQYPVFSVSKTDLVEANFPFQSRFDLSDGLFFFLPDFLNRVVQRPVGTFKHRHFLIAFLDFIELSQQLGAQINQDHHCSHRQLPVHQHYIKTDGQQDRHQWLLKRFQRFFVEYLFLQGFVQAVGLFFQ